MRTNESGWPLIEILVVITIIATLAGLVSLTVIRSQDKSNEVVCTQHVADLVRLLEADARYPARDGPALLMDLVAKGHIQGRDALENLFCPGDARESYDRAGGEQAYAGLDPNRPGDWGHLTSYAGRAQRDAKCATVKGAGQVVLVADDSDDHHNGRGVVVGLTGGTAKFRDKVDAYGVDKDAELVVGETSVVEELKCLRTQ